MEKREYWVYKFNELSEEGKQKAIERYSDINVEFEWWDSTYEDAKHIGLKITEFDLYRGYARGKFILSPREVIHKIISDHGENCETYKTAKLHEKAFSLIPSEDDDDYDSDQENELSHDFLKDLLEDYRIMLRKEYEYLTEDEQIVDTLTIKEYDFTIDGEID